MQQKKVKEMIRQLAVKYNMTTEEMEKIVRAPTEFVGEVISKKSNREELYFPSIRITGFGIFYCKPSKKEYYRKVNKKRSEKESKGI